ncbi:MAG TPA: hypothetical protein VM820_04950 [Vicinamibacterales bacterium]|jgi:hypothetical protein|nr:hypothetical protein [Vicinamibacterales bacterium]
MVLGSGRISLRAPILASILVVALSSQARAQSAVGFTGGGSIDPEQVFVGVFWQSADIGGRFRIRPGIDGGFGDGLRLATINVDFVYLVPLGQGPWKFVTGGGPTIVLRRFADDQFDTGTEVTAGGSYLLGFSHDNGFFAEFRLGGGNVPQLKFGVGWALKIQ